MADEAKVVIRFDMPIERGNHAAGIRRAGALVKAIGDCIERGELDNNIRGPKKQILGAYYVTIKDEEEEEKWG